MKSDAVFEFATAGWPMLLVDASGIILRANPAAVHLFGNEIEKGGPPLSSIWSSENSVGEKQFLSNWQNAPVPASSLKFRANNDAVHSFSTSICSFASGEDIFFIFQLLPEQIAESKGQPGESLIQKQKLDCAMQLARTVALDFNNALTSILGHTSLLLSKIEPNSPWRNSLLEVEKSAARAAEIANDLSTFSHQEKESHVQASGNLNSILQRSVEAFKNSPEGALITWTLQFERKLFSAKFDEARMQQAVMKIIENASEALGADGKINVQTRNIELSQPTQDRGVKLAAGTHVCLEITDNGAGIEPDILPRIFEPFFTTKKPPHRGLGLAWVYGIATNHGGGVTVSSQPGAGTSVRLYLPAETKLIRESADNADLNGTETVLMVDDEDLLLTMGETILSTYGYRVLTANSGQKALEILAQGTAGVDLLITDLVMPTMSGRELVEHVHRLSPATRILCTSGYVHPNRKDDAAYLQKPFTSQELLKKVKQALTAGDTTFIDG